MQLTLTTLKIVKTFVVARETPRHGYEIARSLGGVSRHRVYETLASLERSGWIKGEYETPKPEEKKGRGPVRRFYLLTDSGFSSGLAALSALQLSTGAFSSTAFR